MSFMMPDPPDPAPTPKASDEEISAQRKAERERLLKRQGLADTILTSGQGLGDTAPVEQKTLLG